MLKYLTKIAMDIFPSVLATIIGAYIVNHYINARPANAPVAAAVAPAKNAETGKADGRSSTNVASLPAPGVTARGISERPLVERAEIRPVETKPAETKPAETRSAATASAPPEPRRHQPAPREKVMAKLSPATPPVVPPPVAAPVETAAPAASEDRKDATDLARAAIERLRNTQDGPPRVQDPRTQETAREMARASEPPRTIDPARPAAQPALRPLPPPINVSSTPGSDTYGLAPGNPPYTGAIRSEDRPIPPVDIPGVRPPPSIDLRADATGVTRERPTAADDMLSAAKSMFNAVLPKSVAD